MDNFIRVLGENPFYKSLKLGMWLSTNSISRVYPVHTVKGSDGKNYQCTTGTEDAEITSYRIEDHSGNKYYCNGEELKKIGINVDENYSHIGFVPDIDYKDKSSHQT